MRRRDWASRLGTGPRLALACVLLAGPPAACGSPAPDVPGTPAPSATAVEVPSDSSAAATTGTAPAATPDAVPTPRPRAVEHRIAVRAADGGGELYDTRTGQRFVPRGFNLIRLAGGHHSTLDVGRYDPEAADAALARMAAGGYNTVRVFLNTFAGGLPGGPDGLSPAYLDNVADFLGRAAAHGMVVLLTTDWLPDDPAFAFGSDALIENVNSLYLSSGGVDANARFFRAFARGLVERGAALDALLAYELRNELYFTDRYPPFSLREGLVTAANGVTYDLAADGDRRALLEDNLVAWVDRMRSEILAMDPTALVTTGFFQPQGPNRSRVGDDRLIETAAVIRRSSLDFIDLHGYPGGELDLGQIVENFALPRRTDKPVLLGEFGAEHGPYPTSDDAVRALAAWQVESCDYGFDGWLMWTWDTGAGEQPEFWNALDGGGALEQALSPERRPDPCTFGDLDVSLELALDARVRASSRAPGFPAVRAVDGLADTWWNAATGPPQWIEVDLGRERTVDEIRLLVAQSPAGRSRHVVSVRGETGGWREVAVLAGRTSDGQWLSVLPDRPIRGVRRIRVETTSIAGGLWPAWREISVLGPPAG